MLRLIDPGSAPSGRYSKQKVECLCTCGNPRIYKVSFNTFAARQPSCGRCSLFTWKATGQIKYARLTLDCPVDDVHSVGRAPIPWLCDCGNRVQVPLSRVISGNTRSCGCLHFARSCNFRRHESRPKSVWLAEIPELVDDDLLPEEWSFRARLKPNFRCLCSRIYRRTFWAFQSGKSTCGRCDQIRKGDKNFGLIYDDEPVNKTSTSNKYFVCEHCGIRDLFCVRYVTAKKRGGCRNCSAFTVEDMTNNLFGKLRLKDPRSLKRFSTEHLTWICACGNDFVALASNVLNGNTKSCGQCRLNVENWWQTHEPQLRDLRCPLQPHDIPAGGVVPLETIQNTKRPFLAVCPVCGSHYKPRWEGVRAGISLTCGCASVRISFGHREIYNFLLGFMSDACLEYSVNGLKYDIFLPSSNLLIEYNGIKWHSMSDSKKRDRDKYLNAVTNGYDLIVIYEDEWLFRPGIMKNILLNRLGLTKPSRVLRPSQVKIVVMDSAFADLFYGAHHYIGGCRSPVNYCVYADDQLIACASFRRPARPSKHPWELARMCSDSRYHVHGLWSKIMKCFVKDYTPLSIVSFSDNRLFTGSVYSNIGFILDGELGADYYWCKGGRRYHKSGLRKPPGDLRTETEIRTSEGYTKIWDFGKKRWVWQP